MGWLDDWAVVIKAAERKRYNELPFYGKLWHNYGWIAYAVGFFGTLIGIGVLIGYHLK